MSNVVANATLLALSAPCKPPVVSDRTSRNPVASRRRRLPYVAKIKRGDPFRPEDERDIASMCKRIAAAGECMALAGWREDAGYRVFHFGTWAKARAMQHWIDRSGIAHRPMPKLGETAEEREERCREHGDWKPAQRTPSCKPTGRRGIDGKAS